MLHKDFFASEAILIGNFLDLLPENCFNVSFQHFITVFGAPDQMVVQIIDGGPPICKPICVFHINYYTTF